MKEKTTYSSFQRNLHFTLKVCSLFYKYVLILILGIITTVNGFLFYSFQRCKAKEDTGQTHSLSVCCIRLRVCSVSDCIAFFYKGYLFLFFAVC